MGEGLVVVSVKKGSVARGKMRQLSQGNAGVLVGLDVLHVLPVLLNYGCVVISPYPFHWEHGALHTVA